MLGETGTSSPLSLLEASVYDLAPVEQQTTISNEVLTVAEAKGTGYVFILITLIAAVLAAMVIRKN